MKKTTFTLVAVLALLGGCKKADTSPLVVATAPCFPPFSFVMDGRTVGQEIELAELVARDLGRPLVIKETAFSNLLETVMLGRADIAVGTVSITPEREKIINFSRPYYRTGTAIVSPESAPLRGPEDTGNKLLGVQSGTRSGAICREVLGARTTEFDDLASMADAILEGRIDGAVADAPMARTMILGENELAITSPFLSEDNYAAVIAKENPAILKAVNRTIQKLESSGELGKICDKWFRISDEYRKRRKTK